MISDDNLVMADSLDELRYVEEHSFRRIGGEDADCVLSGNRMGWILSGEVGQSL